MSLYNDASLVLIPSGYKDGKVYSIKPTNGDGDFTFSRGSNLAATRVNVNGLIEKGRENLLLQSNQFDTTWTTSNASVTSGQSGYDGSSDAWLLTATSTSNCRINQTISGSGVQTLSVYAKANTADFLAFNPIVSGTNPIAYFDLSNGIVGTTNSAVIDAEIVSIGSGWYRCSISFNDTNTEMRILVVDADNSTAVTSGNSIYIQDAQLEYGLVATDYIETTTTTAQAGILEDMPRLDYSGGASCPSLLIEPQRTNLMIQSEYAGAYTTNGVGTITDNAETSPEGVGNAFELNDTSSGTYFRIEDNITLTATDHTLSVFVKKTSGTLSHYAGLQLDSSRKYVILDTTNGTYNEATGTDNDSVNIQDFSDDWWRVIITNSVSAGSIRIAVWPALSDNGTSISVNATGSNVFYGLQLESASYPTSYIPTYGASVTALKDDCYNLTFSDLQTTDATIFAEFNYDSGKTGAFRFVFCSENSTTGSLDSVQLNSAASGVSFSFNIQGSGISFSTLSLLDGNNKALIKFERSTGAVKTFLNGVEVDSGTAASIPEIHKLAMGSRINPFATFARDRQLGDIVSQFLAFPTALTDSECIALTTL